MDQAFDGDETAAWLWFADTYGFDPFLISTPKTVGLRTRSTTQAGHDFQRENPDLFAEFPITAYFGNPDLPGQFERGAILRQIRADERVGLTPDQWLQRRNDSLARILMDLAQAKVGSRTDQASDDYIFRTRIFLELNYPGYGSNTNIEGIPARATPIQRIRELQKWDGALAKTQTGQALAIYFQVRDSFIDKITAGGLRGDTSQALSQSAQAAPLREALRTLAGRLIKQYPQFEATWEQILRRELKEDEDALQRAARLNSIPADLLLKPLPRSLSGRHRNPSDVSDFGVASIGGSVPPLSGGLVQPLVQPGVTNG